MSSCFFWRVLRAWVFILMIIYLFVWAHLETFTYLSSFCVLVQGLSFTAQSLQVYVDDAKSSLTSVVSKCWHEFFVCNRFLLLFSCPSSMQIHCPSFFLCSCAKIHRKYSFWVSPNKPTTSEQPFLFLHLHLLCFLSCIISQNNCTRTHKKSLSSLIFISCHIFVLFCRVTQSKI